MPNRAPSPQSSPGWIFSPASTEASSRAENRLSLPNRALPWEISTRVAYSLGTVSLRPLFMNTLPSSKGMSRGSKVSSSVTSSVSTSGSGAGSGVDSGAGSGTGSDAGWTGADSEFFSPAGDSCGFLEQAARITSSRARIRHRIFFIGCFMVLLILSDVFTYTLNQNRRFVKLIFRKEQIACERAAVDV